MARIGAHDHDTNSNSSSSSSSSSNSVGQSLFRVCRHTRIIKSSNHVYKHPLFPTSDGDADHSDTVSVDSLFGPLPSESEIQNALTSLQQAFGTASRVQHVRNIRYYESDNEVGHATNTSSDGSETDWKEPSLVSYNPRMLQADVSDKATFAIHLLQNDAHVQRMVKSLSSDKSVWDAVLNNEAVRELRNALTAERDHNSNGMANNDSPNTKNVFMRISGAAKAKLMEAIEKITKMVKKLFQNACHLKAAYAGKSNSFKNKLSVSVMLSIMIFLMVMVDRF